MAIDPHIDLAINSKPGAAVPQDLGDLERRVRKLEQNQGLLTQILPKGTPERAPRGGSLCIAEEPKRLYVYIGGAWHYATLT